MDNIIVIVIAALIIGLAVFYIRKEKRHSPGSAAFVRFPSS